MLKYMLAVSLVTAATILVRHEWEAISIIINNPFS